MGFIIIYFGNGDLTSNLEYLMEERELGELKDEEIRKILLSEIFD